MRVAPHPAPFNPLILQRAESEVRRIMAAEGLGTFAILDPFAGVGRIHDLTRIPGVVTVGIELEREWAYAHPCTIHGDSTDVMDRMAERGETFDAVVTSPCYGNRMADHHNARERCRACNGSGMTNMTPVVDANAGTILVTTTGTAFTMTPTVIAMTCPACNGQGYRHYRRHTYRHYLDRPLTEGSAGAMQWGPEYRLFHTGWAQSMGRVVRSDGWLILNMSDHVRGGRLRHVTGWWITMLVRQGWLLQQMYPVETPRQRHGENRERRAPHEWVLTFRRIHYPGPGVD